MASSSGHFNGFEVLDSCPDDHRFYKNPKKLGSGALKRIAKEWKMLDGGLPRGSIFVQVYESQLDVMTAVRTQYHDGLLNTWTGSRSERWDPANSTVLQVLVSLQGLVLISDPYGTKYYHKMQNEEVFVITCLTAHHLLSKKPQGFEDLVVEHYRERSSTILKACRAYWSGSVKVGLYGSASTRSKPSDEFKKKMPRVYDLLVEAFWNNSIQVPKDLVELEAKWTGCGNIIQWFRGFFR